MPTDQEIGERAWRVMNRLAKWRAHFAGWQLGTRPKDDPEAQAVRDTHEILLFLRAEVSAQSKILIDKGICTQAELTEAISDEAEILMVALEQRWSGIRATDDGLSLDIAAIKRAGWQRNWKP